MIFQYDDYRIFLRTVLIHKKQRNSSYSLRAFANSLNLPVSTLSNVLNGKRHLTLESADKSLVGLKLCRQEARYYKLLVQRENLLVNSEEHLAVQEQVFSLAAQARRSQLDCKGIDELTQVWKFALIELAGISGYRLDVQSAAKALVLSEKQASDLLHSLVRSGHLQVDEGGQHKKVGTGVLASSETINFNLRQFHMETMELAKKSLVEQAPVERFVGSETFSFASNQIEEANEIIEEFFSKMVSLANRAQKKDSVYHLGVQMFRLTQTGSVTCSDV